MTEGARQGASWPREALVKFNELSEVVKLQRDQCNLAGAQNVVEAELMACPKQRLDCHRWPIVLARGVLRLSAAGQMRRMRWMQWESVASLRPGNWLQ